MQESLSVAIFALTHYLFIIAVALLCYGVGLRLTRRIQYHSVWEEAGICISLGLGVLAGVVFVLAAVGLLYRLPVALTICGLIALSSSSWLELARRFKPAVQRLSLRQVVSGLFVFMLISPILVLPLYPPTAWDSIEYHLPVAKAFIESHALVFTPTLRFPSSTQTNHMLFAFALLFFDDIAAQLFEFLMLGTVLVAIVGLACRFFSLRVGLWSAALMLANPIVVGIGAVALIDMGLVLFVTMTVSTFAVWLQTREDQWMVLSGVFCGLATGIKAPGLFFFIVLAAAALYVCWRDRRFRPLFIFSFGAVLLALPWYVRSFYYTGNPLYPLPFPLQGIFGYRFWPLEYTRDTVYIPDSVRIVTGRTLIAAGIEQTLVRLLTLPWNLFVEHRLFANDYPFSPIHFFTLPIVAIFGLSHRRIRYLLLLVLSFTAFWFVTIQVSRYLLPIFPIFCVATAAAFDRFLASLPGLIGWIRTRMAGREERVSSANGVAHASNAGLFPSHMVVDGQRRQARRRFGPLLVGGIPAILLVASGLPFAFGEIAKAGRPPVDAAERHVYLSAALPQGYLAYRYLNDRRGREYTVYALFNENMVYYAEGHFLGDNYGPARYSRIVRTLHSGEALYDELRAMDADFFLVVRNRAPVQLPEDDFFHGHFNLVFSDAAVSLYELHDASAEHKTDIGAR